MDAFFQYLAAVLAWFYSVIPNYALSIVFLTLLVMIIVTPLTLKGTRSMMVMQQMQPEIKKIQQRYKDDRQKQNEELLKFYKENNLNPLGGCLPLLVQMPVFLVLYEVLRGLTRRVNGLGFNTGWVTGQEALGSTPTKAPSIERPFDPAYLNHNSKMYQNLQGSTTMSGPLGVDLAESCSQALKQGIGHALPYIILIAIVAFTGIVQQRQIQGRNPNAQTNPQQQMIMKVMPFFLPVISFALPAGLVLYFAVSNLYRIGQQAFISRSIYGMSKGEAAGGAGGGRGPSGDAGPDKPDTGPSKPEKPSSKAATSSNGGARKSRSTRGSKSGTDEEPPGDEKGGRQKVEAKAKPRPKTKTPEKAGPAAGGSKRTTASKRSNQPAKANEPAPAPTLQPRARKNKKR